MEDHEVPSFEQRFQGEAGGTLALRSAVAALIATHPDKQAFLESLAHFDGLTRPALSKAAALAFDDGLRAAYAEGIAAFQRLASGD